jgi:hypothetical protein
MKTRPPPSLEEQRAVLNAIEQLEADKAKLYARGAALRAELARLWASQRSGFAEMELAGTALIGQIRAARELDDGTRLADSFPRLAELLDEGLVFVPTAEELLRATRRCTPEVQIGVDARIADKLIGTNITDARRLIAHNVLAVEAELDPELTQQRLDQAKKDARVWSGPGADGMSSIGAILDAVAGRRWMLDFGALVQAQLLLDKRAGRDRPVGEVRVEVFATLPSLVLELLRAARDGRLHELADLDADAAAEVERLLADTSDLPIPDEPPDDAAAEPAAAEDTTGEVRVEEDPFDPAVAEHDPWTDLTWEPADPPEEEPPEPGPPPNAAAAQDAAFWRTAQPAQAPDLHLQVLMLRCLQITPPNPVTVALHIPMATVLDLTDAPGILEGHGPLDARRIRQLLPDARLREIYVDHDTGTPLGAAKAEPPRAGQADLIDLARRLRPVTLIDHLEPQHDPSSRLAEFVKLRDQRCPGPGCTMPASRCDLDHQQEHPDGPTAEWNLDDKSRRCHGAKHHGWTATRHPDGSTDWISPTGRTYTSRSAWQPPPALPKRTFQIHLPRKDIEIEIDTEHRT